VQYDLYALGAVVYLLLTGSLPDRSAPVAVEKLRRNIPKRAREIINVLLGGDTRNCPDATTIAEELTAVLPVSDNPAPATFARGPEARL
jgi:serine/threonine protein kinase